MLATCIMPTHDRRAFVPRAVTLFLAQDVEGIELLILDGGADPVRDLIPVHPRVRYLYDPARMSLGARRNRLCREARGEFIVHWDDDDWYPPHRVRVQVEALRARGADACGSHTVYYHEPATDLAWRYACTRSEDYVTGNTLAYRKTFWERSPFADVQVGEDTRFVRSVPRGRLVDLADPALCVATIHPHNISPKRPGGSAWSRVDASVVHTLMTAGPLTPTPARVPRVSCIMPTADRRPFLALALELFAAQTWPDRELIVIDGGIDPIGDLCAGVSGVRHVRTEGRTTLGERRNLACQMATGEFIAHWDDDDWYGPDRLARQVEPIVAGRADVTGLENHHTLHLPDGDFWSMTAMLHQRMFVGDVHGGTLVYRRALLRGGTRYPNANLAEDAALLRDLLRGGARLEKVTDEGLFVYVRHGRNAWRFETGRFLDPAGWRRSERPLAMPESMLERYRTIVQEVSGPGRAALLPPKRDSRRDEPFMDCLGAVEVARPREPIRCDRCVVLVASDRHADLLDAALASLARYGALDDVKRVVLVEASSSACERAATRHEAAVLRFRPLRAPSPSLKGALYSVGHLVEARQYLCLDADLLVLESLAPLFAEHGGLGAGRVLIAPESTGGVRPETLGAALRMIYRATDDEVTRLTRGDARVAGFDPIVNDGVFVADREVLLAVDQLLRDSPEIVAWVHGRADVWWRQKAAFNLALARLGCVAPLDPSYNVQLHVERVEPTVTEGRVGASWQGRPVNVLHFNGGGRRAHTTWARRILRDSAPIVCTPRR